MTIAPWRLALGLFALVLLRGDMYPDASNAVVPQAANNLNPGVVTADLRAANGAADNNAALQAAITAACSAGGSAYREVRLPPGSFAVASTTVPIPCGSISIGGAGYFATVLNVGTGAGDFLKCVVPAGFGSSCWHAKIHDFAILRSDSPASGAGILLDRANDVQIENMRIYGFFYNVDCLSCGNVTFGGAFNAGGIQTQAGSAIVRVHRATESDATPTAIFFGDGFNLGANPAGNYDHALVVGAVDGLNLGNGHISYTRGDDVLIQPDHPSDGVHGVASSTNTYFDQTSGHCVAVKAYGAVDGTVAGATASGNTTLTLGAPPAVDVTGYGILANGVTAGTTVSSGGATNTMTMSAGANALGVANGDWVTFYPAYTGAAGTHKLYGICNSPGISGVLLADPAAGRIRVEINGHNSVKELYDFRAGTNINATGSTLYNAGQSGGSFPAVRVGGNASMVNMAGVALVRGTVQPQYHVKKEGQAGPLQISGQFFGSGIADVLDTALVPSRTSVAGCITDNSAQNAVPGVGCAIGAPVQQIAGSGLPFVVPSSGTMANNGALTVTTALAGAYLRAYFWMPAGAIAAGSAAGWYYTVCASTTVCTVRNNVYASGIPSVPASPAAFATTGPGAYTQDLTEIVGQAFTVPANAIGQNGTLQGVQRFVMAASANNKTAKVKFGGGNAFVKAYTTNTSEFIPVDITARSRTDQQVTVPIGLDTGYGAAAALFAATGANITAASTYSLSCQLASAADYCVMDSVRLVAYPAQ